MKHTAHIDNTPQTREDAQRRLDAGVPSFEEFTDRTVGELLDPLFNGDGPALTAIIVGYNEENDMQNVVLIAYKIPVRQKRLERFFAEAIMGLAELGYILPGPLGK